MRNFTAGIERASSPRRKRMTLWSGPWRPISTPMANAAVGSSVSARTTASSTRWPSMNCSEPARGKTPRTRTRTKSESSPWSFIHAAICALLVMPTERESDLFRAPAMGEAAAGEAFAEAARGARRVAEHRPHQLAAAKWLKSLPIFAVAKHRAPRAGASREPWLGHAVRALCCKVATPRDIKGRNP
jgi:hypothetical protein